ncbi:hypothetical protein O3M35_005132 [Rhynocoris fuscipes]|uniref:Cilia- and flagella-associated protein 91 n=1 Tax=Rhynocoris fuscipes TaxID=488301 RepID=A0AAW1DHY8_9HEMI
MESAYDELQKAVMFFTSKSKKCQTIYKDSECQTDPWAPPYIIHSRDVGVVPEALTLTEYYWGYGLPFDKLDVLKLDGIRKKKAWELYYMNGPFTKEQAQKAISYLSFKEPNFVEEEYNRIIEARLELAAKEIKEQKDLLAQRRNLKIANLKERSENFLTIKKYSLNKNLNKALRLLNNKDRGITNRCFPKGDLLQRYLDKSSDIYQVPTRCGADNKFYNQRIAVNFDDEFEILCSLDSNKIFKKPKEQYFHKAHVCDTTYWPAYHYKGVEEKKSPTFRRTSEIQIPSISLPDFAKEKVYRAAVFLQRLIRGRAIQSMMYSYRNQYLDTIMALRDTFGVCKESAAQVELEHIHHATAIRNYNLVTSIMAMVKGIINQTQGAVISSLLDFAYKELSRFEDERTTFKLVTGVHHTRWARESEEAGVRQKELRRRRQHQEMTRMVVKGQQLSLDEFVNSLMNEAMAQEAEEAARETTQDKADLQEPRYHEEFIEAFDRELLTTRLLFSHMIPEAERLPIRQKVEERQEKYRRNAYRLIFGHEETDFSEDETESERNVRLARIKNNKEAVKNYEASRFPSLGMDQDEIYEYLQDFLHEARDRMNLLQEKSTTPVHRPAHVILPSINTVPSESSGDSSKCIDP